MSVKVIEYDFCNGSVRWQLSKSIKVAFDVVVPARIVSETLIFELIDLEKVTITRAVNRKINCWFVRCIHVDGRLSRVKNLWCCKQKRDISSRGVIILKENLIQIGLTITHITLWNVTLPYIFNVSWCIALVASQSCIILENVWLKTVI